MFPRQCAIKVAAIMLFPLICSFKHPRSSWYFSLGKYFLNTCDHSFSVTFSSRERKGAAGGLHLMSPRSRTILALGYVILQEGRASSHPQVWSLNPLISPSWKPVWYMHLLSIWLPGSLVTLFPWSGLSVSCCHRSQGHQEVSFKNGCDLISPRAALHRAPS